MARMNTQKHVLLIDDDQSLLEILSLQLKHADFIVDTACTGREGYTMATNANYDVIVLDMGLPDERGSKICKEIRDNGVLAPILILSGETEKQTIVTGLEAGADDYLVKPFVKDELKARLKALIRRNRRLFSAQHMDFHGLTLNLTEHTLHYEDRTISLTSLEVLVMKCLMQYAPNVVPREYFFEQVWGIDDEHTSNRLDVYMRRVRHKLKKLNQPLTIHTVHSKGYRIGE